jgi:hypothetical protein
VVPPTREPHGSMSVPRVCIDAVSVAVNGPGMG